MKKNNFWFTLEAGLVMRWSLAITLAAGSVWAAAPAPPDSAHPPPDSALPIVTSVRIDSRTGRLLRTVQKPKVARKPKPEIQKLIEEKALRHEIDPLLIHSLIQVESNYDPHALSSKGAMGLMQLIPDTARRFGVRNPFDVSENLEGGIRYLKYLNELHKGDQKLVLASYNAGEGAVARYGGSVPPYAETRNYVSEVSRRYGQARSKQPKKVAERNPKIEQFVDAEGRIHFEIR